MIRLIGPGGAGKSTTSALLAERLNYPSSISTGTLLAGVGDITQPARIRRIRSSFAIDVNAPTIPEATQKTASPSPTLFSLAAFDIEAAVP